MRFLIDANLPRSAIAVIQKFWHQVEFARDIGLAAAPDERIAARARAGALPDGTRVPRSTRGPTRDCRTRPRSLPTSFDLIRLHASVACAPCSVHPRAERRCRRLRFRFADVAASAVFATPKRHARSAIRSTRYPSSLISAVPVALPVDAPPSMNPWKSCDVCSPQK